MNKVYILQVNKTLSEACIFIQSSKNPNTFQVISKLITPEMGEFFDLQMTKNKLEDFVKKDNVKEK